MESIDKEPIYGFMVQAKGTVQSKADLPRSANNGDAYYCSEAGCIYVYYRREATWVQFKGDQTQTQPGV